MTLSLFEFVVSLGWIDLLDNVWKFSYACFARQFIFK